MSSLLGGGGLGLSTSAASSAATGPTISGGGTVNFAPVSIGGPSSSTLWWIAGIGALLLFFWPKIKHMFT